jgi:signal transduction histidine kinase
MDRARVWHGVTDAVLAAALAVAAVLELTTGGAGHLGVDAPLVGAIGIVATTVLLALRRIRPGWLPAVPLVWLVLGLATAGVVPVTFWGALVPFWLTLYSVARHGSVRLSAVTAGVTAAVLLLGGLTLAPLHSWNEALFDWGSCALAFVVGWGLRRGERRAVEEALRAARAEADARERPLAAVADERARIARELHDVLGHSVSAMVVQAGAAEQVVDDDPDFVLRALASIRTTGAESLDEVRRAIDLLRADGDGPGLAPQPGLTGLADLAATAADSGIAVDLDVRGEPTGLPAGLELAVYRIVQESLTNVRKHSGATRADVRVICGPDAVEVVVRDDGVDAASTTPGHGLIGMRERAHLYGGSLDAGPETRGFAVRAVLPTGTPA